MQMKNGMKQLQVHMIPLETPVLERNMSYSACTVKLGNGLIAQQVKIRREYNQGPVA